MGKEIKNVDLARDINNNSFVVDPMELSLVEKTNSWWIKTGIGKDYVYYNSIDANNDWEIINKQLFVEK